MELDHITGWSEEDSLEMAEELAALRADYALLQARYDVLVAEVEALREQLDKRR
jgi:cell division protein FtsB